MSFWSRLFTVAKPAARVAGKTALTMSAAGTLAAGMLIKPWESRAYVAYYDVGGVLTVCDGHTGPDIVLDKVYTDKECDGLLAADVNKHERAVDAAIDVDLPIETKAAFISFAYNVGPAAFANSTLARLANAGDLRGACEQLSRWVFVQGKVVRGLENRRFNGDLYRISERTMCLVGLDPAYKTPLYEQVHAKFVTWRTQLGEAMI